jgi:carbonic anhydrase
MRRALALVLLCAAPALGACRTRAPVARATPASAAAQAPALDADTTNELLEKLIAGNERYRSGRALHPRQDAARRAAVAGTQSPRVAVLACADSRTAPEVVFDQGLGDLFVVRIAGNVASDEAIASLEYAVEHLGVRLIVVLGHERCGAVKAALAGGQLPGHLPGLIAQIQPAVQAVPDGTADRENAVIAKHADLTSRKLGSTMGELLEHHRVLVVAGVYDLDTGAVEFVEPLPPPPPSQGASATP